MERALPFPVRWLLVVAAAAALLVALEMRLGNWGFPAPPAIQAPAAPQLLLSHPADYAQALADLDRGLQTARERAGLRPDEWLAQELLARAWFDHGRLTGSYDDYAAADAALRRAFAVAPPGAGPHMLQASFDFTMHRLGAAEAQLARVEHYAIAPDAFEQSEIEAMRGDIAFYRGNRREALSRYDAADRLRPGATDFRRAVFQIFTGDPAEARRFIDRSERGGRMSVQSNAWMELQRGIFALERHDVAEARVHFERANRMFPGYWLIEEHLAETSALMGDIAGAEARYRDIVRRTGSPEFMDALATLARQRGDAAEAQSWLRRAAPIWQRRLVQFPEATYGHAIDHCLAAQNWPCAVRLARRNHAARPYGEAKTLLALALLRSGRRDDAARILDELLALPWRSARTLALAAELGRPIG